MTVTTHTFKPSLLYTLSKPHGYVDLGMILVDVDFKLATSAYSILELPQSCHVLSVPIPSIFNPHRRRRRLRPLHQPIPPAIPTLHFHPYHHPRHPRPSPFPHSLRVPQPPRRINRQLPHHPCRLLDPVLHRSRPKGPANLARRVCEARYIPRMWLCNCW